LIGILYLSGFGYASPSLESVAYQTVRESLPANVYSSAFGNANQAYRFKRAIVTKTLEDPKNCIRDCRNNETANIITATVKNMAKLVAVALEDITGDETSTPEKEAAFKKRIEEKTIANMGPFFADLCTATQKTDACYSACPDSKLKTIVSAEHSSSEAFCEPGKNWKSFSDYWASLNCTNSTEEEKPCDNKCGVPKGVGNVTGLSIDEEDEGVTLKYETDSKKNTAAVGPECKSTSCQLDCYKPIMTAKCGAKAYDLYSRMTKIEPRSSLRILTILDAVDQTSDCKAFQ